jgi:hypothetical protein
LVLRAITAAMARLRPRRHTHTSRTPGGEGVFTPGQMAALGAAAGAGGGRSPQVTINNYTDAAPSVEQVPNGDITVTLRKMVDGAVGDSLSTGTGRRVLGDQYGVKPFTGQ